MMPSFVTFQFVASPKCQRILNEVVYLDPCWQDRNVAMKLLWVIFQWLLVVAFIPIYIPYKLAQLCLKRTCYRGKCMSDCCSGCHNSCMNQFWNLVRNTFEHPYSKFINHTTWYLLFLSLVFASTFQKNFGTTSTGLSRYGQYT